MIDDIHMSALIKKYIKRWITEDLIAMHGALWCQKGHMLLWQWQVSLQQTTI